jgi:hypothetical protein
VRLPLIVAQTESGMRRMVYELRADIMKGMEKPRVAAGPAALLVRVLENDAKESGLDEL